MITTACSTSTKRPDRRKWIKHIRRRFPILQMLASGYPVKDALSDILAGFTVSLSTITQAIAFAIIAELPPQYGLYSSFIGCFVYIFLGGVPAVTVGPTTLMSLMTQRHSCIHPGFAPFLAFCNGLIILACSLLRLGLLVDFVSSPVLSGFLSAASLTIGGNQLKNLCGLSIQHKSKLPGILRTLSDVATNIGSFQWTDFCLGISSVAVLLFIKFLPNFHCVRNGHRAWRAAAWVICISRNALVVLIGMLIAYLMGADHNGSLKLAGSIEGGLPQLSLPPFGINRTQTVMENPSLYDIVSDVGSVLITLPMVCIITHIAIAKAFSSGPSLDATQELFALGVSNLAGSFFLSMPVDASFSRSAVNAASGAKTTLGGFVTGMIVLLSLIFLMPYCAFIPKTSLAAVIICAVIFTIEYHVIVPIWKAKKMDLVPGFVTFFGCLLWSIEGGILIGIGINLCFILYHSARPEVTTEMQQWSSSGDQVWITFDHGWLYPATSHLRARIDKIMQNYSDMPNLTVVFNMANMNYLDYTSAQAFLEILSRHEQSGHVMIVYRLKPSLQLILENANHEAKARLTFVEDISLLSGKDKRAVEQFCI